jgi:hypothetical protein
MYGAGWVCRGTISPGGEDGFETYLHAEVVIEDFAESLVNLQSLIVYF